MEENTGVMTKQEFLDSLRAALASRVGTRAVSENISFYEDYINTQVRMGRSEAEVIAQLGDPRLLARSIAEAEKRAGTGREQEDEYKTAGRGYASGQSGAYGYSYGEQNRYGTGQRAARGYRAPLWVVICTVLLVVILVLSFVFSVLSFLAPVLIPVLLIIFVVRMFRRLL